MKDIFGMHHGLDERSMESLVGALERENLPGFDYLEFKQSLERLQALEVKQDDAYIYKSAFATASTMGLTKEKLIKTAAYYKQVLDKEKKIFDNALGKQIKAKVDGKRKEVEMLRKKLGEYEAKINELEALKASAEKTISEADETIQAAQESINDVHQRFEATLNALLNQIDSDIEDINRYL
jgi:chromosome segregation ATPase